MEAKIGPLEETDTKKRLTSIDMKFFRRTATDTRFDRKRNYEILEK
jgi:hypothetical protein